MIIYDDHIWWSYMMIIYDDHLGVIWEVSGNHLGVIWEPSGSHLGVIWESFWSHLGTQATQEAPGGSRRLQVTKIDAPLSYNAKSSLKCQFYIVFLRVPFTLAAYLRIDLSEPAVNGAGHTSRPLYQDRKNPYR